MSGRLPVDDEHSWNPFVRFPTITWLTIYTLITYHFTGGAPWS